MNEPLVCPKCGAQLPGDAPAGLCPKCLVRAGFESEDQAGPQMERTAPSPASAGFEPPSVEELARRFPQLEVLELLGKGGMGAVYKARQRELDRLVAVKILPPEVARDPAFAERFTREARALARLSHPNIVAVYDFGRSSNLPSPSGRGAGGEGAGGDGAGGEGLGGAGGGGEGAARESDFGRTSTPLSPSGRGAGGEGIEREASLFYFIMEYVDGVNLRQAIESGGVSPKEALGIVPQICDALQFAHDEGIVHRDIKPENILVDKRGRVKIADFGLAKLLGQAPGDVSLTGTQQVMGTLRYMAPEQIEGTKAVDHRADIYSLGVVFYELLTGELPIGRFAPPSKKVQIDVRLDEVVLRALEKEPEQRYQHVSEVKTEVEQISSTPDASAGAPRPLPSLAPIPDASPDATALVRRPAVGLLVTGFLGLLPYLAWFVLFITGGRSYSARYSTLFTVLDLFRDNSLLVGMFLIVTAVLLLWRQGYWLAVVASVVAMLPISFTFIVGLPVGIWALVTLSRPEVRAAFARLRGPIDPQAALRVWGPALALLFTGAGSVLLFYVICVLLPIWWPELTRYDWYESTIMTILYEYRAPLAIPMFLFGVLISVGAAKMLTLRSYPMAMTGAVIAVLPVWPGFVLTLPFGIWALWALTRPEVKAGFTAARPNGAGGPAAPPEAESKKPRPLPEQASSAQRGLPLHAAAPVAAPAVESPPGRRDLRLRVLLLVQLTLWTVLLGALLWLLPWVFGDRLPWVRNDCWGISLKPQSGAYEKLTLRAERRSYGWLQCSGGGPIPRRAWTATATIEHLPVLYASAKLELDSHVQRWRFTSPAGFTEQLENEPPPQYVAQRIEATGIDFSKPGTEEEIAAMIGFLKEAARGVIPGGKHPKDWKNADLGTKIGPFTRKGTDTWVITRDEALGAVYPESFATVLLAVWLPGVLVIARRPVWRLATALKPVRRTVLVAMAVSIFTGLIAASVLVATLDDYVRNAAIPARSLGGVLVMVVSAIATLSPIVLILARRRFSAWPQTRQLLCGVLAPVGFLTLIAVFMIVGLRSKTPILPLPITPTVALRFDGDSIRIDVQPDLATNGGSLGPGGDPNAFEYECSVGYIPGSHWPLRQFVYWGLNSPKQSLVKLSATSTVNQGKRQVTVRFTNSETVNFDVSGLSALEVTVDGTSVATPARIQPETHEIVVSGRPQS